MRKIQAIAPYGALVHEVRVMRADGGWEARIVTLPGQIWVEPGGRRALRFHADSPDAAEAMAVDFIVRDGLARGHRMIAGASGAGSSSDPDRPARRLRAAFPVRFLQRGDLVSGRTSQSQAARTTDLSETGLFIATDGPVPAGTRLSIQLRLPGEPARLEGIVVWVRGADGPGAPAGMGVRLTDPSLSYRARIQSLR